MDDTKDTPKVFANRMIQQIVEHSFGDTLKVEPNDFLVMRTAFRNLGGSWTEISLGSPSHLDILKQVITTWCNTPEAQKKAQGFV